MAVRIFNLRGVPDDEAEEVRALLDENGVEFYETPAGNWGLSMPSLWLRDNTLEPRARELINSYQKERQQRMRGEYERRKAAGENRTMLDNIRDNPLRFILYMAIICGLLYLSTVPFIDLK